MPHPRLRGHRVAILLFCLSKSWENTGCQEKWARVWASMSPSPIPFPASFSPKWPYSQNEAWEVAGFGDHAGRLASGAYGLVILHRELSWSPGRWLGPGVIRVSIRSGGARGLGPAPTSTPALLHLPRHSSHALSTPVRWSRDSEAWHRQGWCSVYVLLEPLWTWSWKVCWVLRTEGASVVL
jgi:hypothetical protein